jgi:hypothetical protein
MTPEERRTTTDARPPVAPSGEGSDAGAEVPSKGAERPAATFLRRIGALLRAQYFEIDRRLLAAFRVYFGLVLLVDILRRFPYLTLFYTNDGVLPNHYALFAPMAQPTFSVFFACSTRGEVALAFTLTALVYVCLIVGYRTKLMQVLTAILYASLISRNLFFEMGGSCALTIAAGWTVFLPLGDRFSVDAMRRSLARRREVKASALNDRREMRPDTTPHASLVMLGLLLQVTAIYFLNFEQKIDAAWKSGDAVHWVLWQNRVATPLCALVRMHEPRWFSPLMSWGTLVVEAISPVMLLTPFVWKWSRSIYVLLALSFHVGIALFVDVGPYSYVMFAFDLLMLPGFWFDWAAERLRRGRVARIVAYDPTDPGLHWMARTLARCDTFELLRFVDRSDASSPGDLAGVPTAPLAVRRPDGTWRTGADAAIDAFRATPFGPALTIFPLRTLIWALVTFRAPLARICAWPVGASESQAVPGAIDLAIPARLPRLRASLREQAAALFAIVTLMQIVHDNWWLTPRVPKSLREGPPGALASIPIYLRQLQGWMMFRVPPRTDGTIIVDATTVDGRHIDPFTGMPPDFDVALHGPLQYGQLFCDYFLRIAEANNQHHRRHLQHYLLNWQELEGLPRRDRLVSFQVLWVESDSPPFGQTVPTHVRRSVILEGP